MDWGANARLVSCTNSLLFSLPKKRGQHAMLCRATWLQGWSEEEEENMPKSLYCGVRGRNRWDRSSGLGRASLNISGFPGGSDGKESTCNVGDLGSIAGLERSPGGGHDNPLQYSCLENPMDRGAWQAAIGWQRVWHDSSDLARTHLLSNNWLCIMCGYFIIYLKADYLKHCCCKAPV